MPKPVKYPIGSVEIKNLSKSEIEMIKKTTTESEYAANYELTHIVGDEQLFREPQFKPFDKRKQSVMYIDPAYMGENKTAVTVAYKTNGVYHVTGWAWSENIVDCYDKIAIICEQYNIEKIFNESNADKGLSSDALRERIPSISVIPVFESQNKEERITQFAYRNWINIYFSHDIHKAYLTDIEDYILGQEPDDAVDSLAGAIRELQTREVQVW
jgi:hypothetical protein